MAKQLSNKRETKARAEKGAGREKKGTYAKYVFAIMLVVIVIGVAIFASSLLMTHGTTNTSFDTFKKNYVAAPRVNIFVAAYNGTVLSSTVGCATAIIEQIVASKTNHRNATTIDLNIINETSCIRSNGLGGTGAANYTTTSLQNCLNTSGVEPSIYINFSLTNTTIIRPDYLYVSGNELFLRECGLASELS
jgi:hypothetical protein